MKELDYRITSNRRIADRVFELRLSGDTSAITAPGQFVNLKIDGCYLRRPISVCNCEPGELTLIYKVVGSGTEILSRMEPGYTVNTLAGLGNGFDDPRGGKAPCSSAGASASPRCICFVAD